MSAVPLTGSTPRGRNFIRSVYLKQAAEGAEFERMVEIAAERWGAHAGNIIARSAVGGMVTGDFGTDSAAAEFMGLVTEQSVFGRLAGLRKIPFHVRLLSMVNGATGYWVGEAKPIPLSLPSVQGATLAPAKVASLMVTTDESLQLINSATEAALQNDLVRAIVESWDQALLDAGNAGEPNVRPASITNGATVVAATANPIADLKALIAAFDGDFASAYFVTDPKTAANLAAFQTSADSFVFPDIGPRGGSLLGIPVLTSRGSPRDSTGGQIALVDPTGIAGAADSVEVSRAAHATLAMSDTPEAEPQQVSLFQTNSVAIKSLIYTNWEVQRTGSVAVLTGVEY